MVKRIDAKFLSATPERSCGIQEPLGIALALMSLASPWEQSMSYQTSLYSSFHYPIIRRLQMSTRKRVRVYGCFCLGLVACIGSVVRVGYSIAILHIPSSSPDYMIVIDITGLWRYEKTPFPNGYMASYTT